MSIKKCYIGSTDNARFYTKLKVEKLKQICKDRKIVGYSKDRKAELVQLLLRHDEEEAKMGAKKGDTVEELRKENALLRKENLFLQLLSSDVFEKVLYHERDKNTSDRQFKKQPFRNISGPSARFNDVSLVGTTWMERYSSTL